MTRLDFEQNICVSTLLIMLEKCTSLICMMLLFISRELSTIGVESSEDALAAAENETVGLDD